MTLRDGERPPSGPDAEERRRIIKAAVDRLHKSDTLRDSRSQLLLQDELERALGIRPQFAALPKFRAQVVALATVCVDHSGGLRHLADCLDMIEADATLVTALLRLADEWQAIQLLAGHDFHWMRVELDLIAVDSWLRDLAGRYRVTPVPDYCESAWQVLAHLTGDPPVPGGGRPAWLRFLEQVTGRMPAGSQQKLRKLIEDLSTDWDTTPAAPAPIPITGPVRSAYLVFQFEQYGADDDVFIMSHWWQWASPTWEPQRGEDRRVRRDELEAEVDKVVLETERRWAHLEGPVTIEFVLPSQLLNEPVDRWCWELDSASPRRLALQFPLVIRSLERIRAVQWHRVWRGRWRAVTEGVVQPGLVHRAQGQTDVQLEAALNRDGKAVVLVLSEPPLPDTTGGRQLLAGFRSGLPVIVWNRNSGPQEALCEVVESMIEVGLDDQPPGLALLPHGVAELRRTAWDEDPDEREGRIGHGLVILWDDPERQPGRDTGEVRA
ncbi:hypothetical protein ACTOB_002972 [Actinoplanes oblitus]|uniref:Uncharacterized protein n=1 Tax=Actinoplanes oblitus TaxID=3040509 RepID=A0ABY8WPD8_9ACTN|nr:hypothetical protein [Actinoplanes oblitus]WIM99322.1 hypothetical protein ACTOB_002972 [Actinoplanes oblitus]